MNTYTINDDGNHFHDGGPIYERNLYKPLLPIFKFQSIEYGEQPRLNIGKRKDLRIGRDGKVILIVVIVTAIGI
jgi:hypothetical protein